MTDTTTEAVERLAEVAATFHATKQPKFEAGDNYKSAVFKMGFRSGYAAILAERDAARQDRDEAMAFAHATARYAKDRAEKAEAEAAALRGEVARLREAMQPFDRMAGVMFARNWNRDGVAISFVEKDGPIRLTFADFLAVRAALTSTGGEG